jgi:rare lipoprotein A
MDITQVAKNQGAYFKLHWLNLYYFSCFSLCLLLSGCENTYKRYPLKQDAAPLLKIDVSQIADAVPRQEPLSRYGNASPYTVLGKKYFVLKTADGYRERGIASWYGMKFHMHLTSNREPYDLLKMTAAHRSLPIPSYVRVTNLNNKKTVIVRVNDRGPFVPTRIIDLSYVAAKKLDMLSTGTAFVEVEAITPKKQIRFSHLQPPSKPKTIEKEKTWIQVGAFQNTTKAKQYAKYIKQIFGVSIQIKPIKRGSHTFYRVIIGPINKHSELHALQRRLQKKGFNSILI